MPFPSNMEISQLQQELSSLRLQNWLGLDLWSLQWWLLLAVLIIPWLIWFRWVDWRRIFELLSFGMMAAVFTAYTDAFGGNYGLYSYPYELLPFTATLAPVSLSFVPVVFMLLYQYSPNWKTFLVNSTLVFAVTAFLAEPLAKYLGMYEMLRWNYFYSFLVYMGTAVLLRAIHLGFRSRYAEEKRVESAKSQHLIPAPALKRQED